MPASSGSQRFIPLPPHTVMTQTLPISALISTVAAAASMPCPFQAIHSRAAARENVRLDIGECAEPGADAGRFQQRRDVRPDLSNPCGVDADQLSR